MNSNLKYKALLILAVILGCLYYIIGIPTSKEQLMANIEKNIRLGLDLKGGSYLVVQVQLQDAFKSEADRLLERVREAMSKANVTSTVMDRNDPTTLADADKVEISIKGVPLDKGPAFRTIIAEQAPEWTLTPLNGTDYSLKIKPSVATALRQGAVTQAVETIKKRIDGLGLAEASVQPRGRADAESEIVIQMPGVDDPGRVKRVLETAAVLELTPVKAGPFPSQEAAVSNGGGVLPLGTKMLPGQSGGWYILQRAAVVTGRDLRDARASRNGQTNQWETAFTLSQDAAKRFGAYTGANIGANLAIVLDNRVISAPRIDGRIEDNGVINGIGLQQEATDLALVLKAGSLPAGLVYMQETTVGPSLGAESIRQGLIAGVFGMVAVILVMLAYYKGAGVNATLALILNAILLIAILSAMGAALTLPGIAGVILTIGIAVDSNVLIFERIREELRMGKAIPAAISAGFSRAFLTIIDTHVTTIVSCAFLFIFGSGPVRGFAVTLVIGLISNVFTAVFVSRTLFDWSLSRNRDMETLSI
jgi:preprotein translocase subunit SecD